MISTRRTNWLALTALILLAGCTPKVVLRPVPLPVIAAPTLTPVTAAQVQCLDDATYTTIVDRENALRRWGQQGWAEIGANNKAASAAH